MRSSLLWGGADIASFHQEMMAATKLCPDSIRKIVFRAVSVSGARLAQCFYATMLEQPRAKFFLSHELVQQRLLAGVRDWLADLFQEGRRDAHATVQRQLELGQIHARAQVPIALIMRGFRDLKSRVLAEVEQTRLSRDELGTAARFIATLMDLALGAILAGHVGSLERAVRSDEALRLLIIGPDVSAERERQRATLAEWAQGTFFDSHLAPHASHRVPLAESEFGLWFVHRAALLFGRSNEYGLISQAITEIDEVLAGISADVPFDRRIVSLREVKGLISRICALLNLLFDQLQASNETRDPLTRLLSRRFLIPVISREISVQEKSRRPFSAIAFAIRDFAALNTQLGEARTDQLVRQTASLLFNAARSSDSVFSMGRDAFFVIRVESGEEESRSFAKAIAERFAATHIEGAGAAAPALRLRFGIAEFDGHPNPRHLVHRAEEALRNDAPVEA